jgi:hypothetical protein
MVGVNVPKRYRKNGTFRDKVGHLRHRTNSRPRSLVVKDQRRRSPPGHARTAPLPIPGALRDISKRRAAPKRNLEKQLENRQKRIWPMLILSAGALRIWPGHGMIY